MHIGCLKVNIFIPHSRSLKERRQVVERVKQKVRNTFNVSVAEKPSDKWQLCELSFSCVNYTRNHVDSMIDKVEGYVRNFYDLHIVEVDKEVF